ncbi:MAG: carboxypeptidase-like regulatory domain-containing protein [Parcubacteria group bacterium]
MFAKTRTKIKTKRHDSGFTLIEGLTLVFILALITVTFYNVITIGTRAIVSSKNRLGAVALANEKMEIARNLAYDDVGTVLGICAGKLLQDENVTENGKTYKVHTYVTYVDDPFDGTLGGSPNDVAYNDYKRLEITVSWDNGGADHGEVKTVSRFVPPGLEVATPGDGILAINVFSDQAGGAPVSGADVHVVNPDVSVNETFQTDATGSVMLLGAKESLQKYQITVSKSGYETVDTFAPYPTTAYNPVDTYASVIGGAFNVTNIIENKVADIKISTIDYAGNPVGDVGVAIEGGRKLGAKALSPFDPVYKLVFDGNTNSSGEKTFNLASPGQYTFGLSSSETTYELIGSNPISPFPVASESSADIKLKVASKSMTGISIKIVNDTNSSLLVGATVELKSIALEYDETIMTGEDGMAFFPNSNATVFQAGTYDLLVDAAGFQSDNESVTIDAGGLTHKDVLMIEN